MLCQEEGNSASLPFSSKVNVDTAINDCVEFQRKKKWWMGGGLQKCIYKCKWYGMVKYVKP